jgi:hypothetical protein
MSWRTRSLATGRLVMPLWVMATLASAQQPSTQPARAGGTLSEVAPAPADAPIPRLPDGRPDLSGVWLSSGPTRDIAYGLLPGEEIVLKPHYKAIMEARLSKDDPEANCLPTGVPRVAPYPWRILQAPVNGKATHLYFVFEGNIHSYRQIFVDSRDHPEDLDLTWYGHSIGSWDGDTLVIDTVGFNDRTWFDFAGHPHTDQLHTIERYTRTNFATMEVETTIMDPGAYEKPFTVKFTATLHDGWDLMEYICNENNIDVQHIRGEATGL